ncbi:MAG: ABC transporter substrate-binding protein [Chitinophagaceae bacterium]
MKRYIRMAIVTTVCIIIVAVMSAVSIGCKKAQGTLNILCFQGYADDKWVKPFEQKYNCKINVTYIGTVDECFAKAKAAPDQYNIVSIDSGRVKMYYDAGIIQSIDTSKVESYSKIGEFFRTNPYAELEPGKKFHVPMCWGPQNFVVNTAKVAEEIKPYLTDLPNGKQALSYKVPKAPEFKDRESIFDESTNVTNMSAIAAGKVPPFQLDDAGYAAMIEELTAWAKNCRNFTAGFDAEMQNLTNEDVMLLLSGNNAIVAGAVVDQGIADKFTQYLPTEGTIAWIDGWSITKPTKGESLELAQRYIDYMISDPGQVDLASIVGFGIVNPAGNSGYRKEVLDACWWYGASIDDFPVPLYVMVTEENPQKRVDTWIQVKASIGTK